MYGLINRALADLVASEFGAERWQAVLLAAQVTDHDFVPMAPYPDYITHDILAAAARELALKPDQLLERLGRFWFGQLEQGHGELLRGTGRTFTEVLENLDAMHAQVRVNAPEMLPPRFRWVRRSPSEIILHYHSDRPGLEPLVRGLLKALAQRMGIELRIRQRRSRDDDHSVFELTLSGEGRW